MDIRPKCMSKSEQLFNVKGTLMKKWKKEKTIYRLKEETRKKNSTAERRTGIKKGKRCWKNIRIEKGNM